MSKKLHASGRKRFGDGKRAALNPELMSLMRLVEAERYADVESVARRVLGKRPNQPLAMKALSFGLIGLGR
ncbi:MAG: hypothetical protein Q7T25_02085, partial [Sideroxyarcus sp.]|nr:hypothetical protein [Sideroxyarcus sp.]